ncbi:hypothetical protein [Candidatus Marinarcus aquaticus]|nr:hypothetical protein [Candidatus Marinarcus aquaticus]
MKKRMLYFGIIFFIISSIGLYKINETIFLNEQKTVYDNVSKVLTSTTNNIKQDLITISSTLAQTTLLQESILQQKTEVLNAFLEQMNNTLRTNFQSNKVFVQVLTKESLYCAANSDAYFKTHFKSYYDKNLKSIKNSKSSMVDINVRNYLNIKSTTPIVEQDKLLGFIEVFALYDIVVQHLRAHKIELIPLLDKQWVNDEYTFKNSPTIADDFIVVNENYNRHLLLKLQTLLPKDMEHLFMNEYLFKHDLFFATFDIRNNRGVAMGKYVAVLNLQGFEYYSDSQNSFLENIITINNSSEDFYNFVKHKEENMFMNIEKGYIKNLKDVVEERDKSEFEEVAREKLFKLSKEELIDFIMQQSKHSEIQGEIR